jgi:uncharacterized membrane protein YhaH (DUF805 family)
MAETRSKPGLRWLFFSFRGRIARQSFLFAVLFQLILLGLMVYQSIQAGENEDRLVIAGLFSIGVMAFCIWSIVALAIKRLHDLDLPGMLFVVLFIPGVNWLALLYLMARPGIQEANEHGPPPFSG